MRTKDGFSVHWQYSNASITSLSLKEVRSLLEGDASSRMVAHAKISEGQFLALFGPGKKGNGASLHAKRRRSGKRLLAYNVVSYAAGLGENRLYRILGSAAKEGWDRKQLIEELMRWS